MSIIKLKDIADKLGVSIVTVSNALSGKKGVSDSLRDEVMRTAADMGYDVSRYQKSNTDEIKIGVLVPMKHLEIGGSFYWSMYQQVAYAASKKNGLTTLGIIHEGNDFKEMPPTITEERIDGIIVIGRIERQRLEWIIREAGVPMVLLDFEERGLPCDVVMSNNYMGMYKVTRYLIEKGHTDIAFVGEVNANDNIMERYFGYRKAMEESGYTVREDRIISDREVKSNIMKMDLPLRMPSAFACNSDFTAGCLHDILIRKGYRIPEHVSIAGYDNYLFHHPLAKSLTTYNVDMEAMSKKAVDLLIKRKRNPDRKYEKYYIDSWLVERSSVKKLK